MTILSGARKFWQSKERAEKLHQHFIETAEGLKADLDSLNVELDGKSILDLGCGTGRILAICKPYRYTGIDQSPQMLSVAKKEFGKTALIEWKQANILKYDTDYHYDVVLLLNVLQHVKDPGTYIRYMLGHFDADTYVIRMFIATENVDIGSEFGLTSKAYSPKYMESLVAIFEKNGLLTSTMVGASLTDDISLYYIVGRASKKSSKPKERVSEPKKSLPSTKTTRVSSQRRRPRKTSRSTD